MNEAACLLDTNVLLRVLTGDDAEKASLGQELVNEIESGEKQVLLSPMVVFELVFTMQNSYKTPRDLIVRSLAHIVSLPTVDLPSKQLFLEALDRYQKTSVGFADVFNSLYARARGSNCVYSWDRDFDRLEGITRREPGAPNLGAEA